jgi:hypothetical protein
MLYALYRLSSGVLSDYGQPIDRYFAKQLLVEPFAALGEPWGAAWMRAHPGVALVRAVVVLGLLTGGFWLWRWRDASFRRTAALAAWVLIPVLPVFTFFHVSGTLEGSRYLYLPAAGFSMLLAGLMGDLARRSRVPRPSAVVTPLVAVLAVPSVVALGSEVRRWTEAARTRDQILESYVSATPPMRCASIVAEGAVDNVDGAFVLRNGFLQALAARGFEAPSDESERSCRVDWRDGIVVQSQQR